MSRWVIAMLRCGGRDTYVNAIFNVRRTSKPDISKKPQQAKVR
ncbi:hypothetical protein [Paraburkholderia sp. J76]|nr:hypothetical protein [Paraburkholderia sp. J76]